VIVLRGVCRVCGCTETKPCHVYQGNDCWGGCAWIDRDRTLCSNILCIARVPMDELLAMIRVAA
jgi:hypothetical protein